MNKKQNPLFKVLFVLFSLLSIGFYLWAKLLLITLFLVLIADSFTTKLIPKYLHSKINSKFYSSLKYTYFILLPVAFAIFIRTFFFDVYYVPSSSMERTLFPGDYVLVNKVKYGTKVPKRMQDIPVIGGLFKTANAIHQYHLYTPLKEFASFSREDIVVFKSVTDNNKFLIKRIIGLPGKTITIKNTEVRINEKSLIEKPEYCYSYIDSSKSFTLFKTYSNQEFDTLDLKKKQHINKRVETKSNNNYILFPYSKQKEWTRDNYGPITIPKKGMTITLTKHNIDLYKSLLKNYENEIIDWVDEDTKNYTFKQDYYFMLGDNRHNSIDSRSYGFVPESYIQGKMILVF